MTLRKISTLPLGTRFRYPGTKQVFVLLDRCDFGLCAHWDGVDGPVKLQEVFSVVGDDKGPIADFEVEVVEEDATKPPERIVVAVTALTWQDRERLFEELLPALFCTKCGNDDPKCQCWNDE